MRKHNLGAKLILTNKINKNIMSQKTLLTKDGIEKLQAEIRHLKVVETKECIEAIYSEQEKETKILCKKNLKQAEIFLASNAKNAGIVCLAEGKVQYLCVSPGNGAEVKPHSAPLLRLSVKTPDGKDILTPNVEESVSLDETIVGLRAGLIGMKEGEKRILYIHPDLAYQEKGLFISLPNVLLTFEIEVLKTN